MKTADRKRETGEWNNGYIAICSLCGLRVEKLVLTNVIQKEPYYGRKKPDEQYNLQTIKLLPLRVPS